MPERTAEPGQRLLVKTASTIPETSARNVRVRSVFRAGETPFESSLQFVLRNRLDVGAVNERHVHPDVEKVYYILAGEAEATAGPWTEVARAGDFIFFPAAIPHQIRNIGQVTLEFVVVAAQAPSPAGLEGYTE